MVASERAGLMEQPSRGMAARCAIKTVTPMAKGWWWWVVGGEAGSVKARPQPTPRSAPYREHGEVRDRPVARRVRRAEHHKHEHKGEDPFGHKGGSVASFDIDLGKREARGRRRDGARARGAGAPGGSNSTAGVLGASSMPPARVARVGAGAASAAVAPSALGLSQPLPSCLVGRSAHALDRPDN